MSSSMITRGAILLMLAFMISRYTSGEAAKVTVGGSNHWRFGFNYTDWALKTAPFYQNDTLDFDHEVSGGGQTAAKLVVFMYDPPNSTTFPHNVYLVKNLRSFISCDLKKATMVGSLMQGGGTGLEFVMKKRKPYYFVCGEGAGIHCKVGLMKFSVRPIKHCRG